MRHILVSAGVLCVGLGIAGVLFTESWLVRSLLLAVGVGVTVHLGTLKTIRREAAVDALSGEGVQKGRA
jgi:hypothetical protein